MQRIALLFFICATAALNNLRAETESIDLKTLAKKARPAVMLLVDKQALEVAMEITAIYGQAKQATNGSRLATPNSL